MAIAIPSDIVADVMNAADPASRQEALARLVARAPAAEQAAMAAFAEKSAEVARRRAAAMPDAAGVAPGTFRPAEAGGPAAVYRKFEGFVLQVLIETMLPNEATVYGKGTAGTVWRSMMAEQLGKELASSGGIGIARLLAAAHPADGRSAEETHGPRQGQQNKSEQTDGI